MTKLHAISLLVDGCHGIYVPKSFAENCDLSLWSNISDEDIEICKDIDHVYYWEAWDFILSNATFTQDGYTWRLEQDGDLWAICYELMTDEEKHNFGFDV